MKKFLPLLFLLFFQLSIKIVIAQEFAPIGATWYYNYREGQIPDYGYVKIEAISDTFLGGKILRKLDIKHFSPWNGSFD
ncbi:MAG: hypothetical protein HY958_11085 [Bacteroidia bacterium]|nr:hypothetical protein [Bacteroidia bacterium]